MIKFIEKYIKNNRRPDFSFDEQINFSYLVCFMSRKFIQWLRGNFWLVIHFRKPQMVFFYHGIIIENFNKLSYGRNFTVGEYTRLNCFGTDGINIGDNCSIGSFCRFIVSTEMSNIGIGIKIGNNVGIGSMSNIGGTGGVSIGDDTIIGPYLTIHSENHIFDDVDKLIRLQGVSRSSVIIGNNCWIGGKVTILSGVTIGNGVVIAANSVVTKDIPSYSVFAGVPGKVIRNRIY